MFSASGDNFTSFFPNICFIYFFFSSIIDLAKTSSIMLRRSGKSIYSFLVPGLRKKDAVFYH